MKSYGDWLRDFGLDHNIPTEEDERRDEAFDEDNMFFEGMNIDGTLELPESDEQGAISVQCQGCGCWFFPDYCYAEDEEHWCGGSPLCIP